MDYEAIQGVIERARVQRDAALGAAIGEACGDAWLAIANVVSRLQAFVTRRSHA